MLRVLLLLCLCLAVSSAGLVCPPDICLSSTQEPLDCKGSILEKASFCGCFDLCAKVDGEECTPNDPLLGGEYAGKDLCDIGLKCYERNLEGHSLGFFCSAQLMVS